jgi:hypothetical protein
LYHVRPRISFDPGVIVEYKYLLLAVEDKVASVTIHRPDNWIRCGASSASVGRRRWP